MFNIRERPYGLLLFAAIASSLAFVFHPINNIDFPGKTMFSVPLTIVAWIIPLLLISFWLLYLLTKRFLYSRTIIWTHVLITVSTTILMVIILYFVLDPLQPASHSYYDAPLIDRQKLIGNTTRVASIIFVCGQCTYLVNLLLGLFAKTNKSR